VVFAEHPVFHNASGCSLSSEVLLQQSMLGGGLWVMRWARHSWKGGNSEEHQT